MKITFEGKTFSEVLDQMESTLAISSMSRKIAAAAAGGGSTHPQGPSPAPDPMTISVGGAVASATGPDADSPADKMAKVRAAKGKGKAAAAAAPASQPVDDEPDVFAPVDPAEMVKIRQKTIEDLQTAYANGHQKEVFELLARFGNGAKSFRELPPDAFMPIRDAIDKGALT